MRFPALPNLKPHSPLPPSPLTLLTSCTSLSHLHQALSHLLKSGLTTHLQILTKFASLSAPLSSPSSLLALLSPTPPDTFLLNTLIRSLPFPISSYSLLLQLKLTPNNFTFPFLLKSLSKNADFRSGVQVHAQIVKFGFADDEYVRNSVVYFYAACGYPALARRALGETPGAGRVAWSALIGGCVRSGFSNVAVDAFREMQLWGVRPDGVTVIAVLSACADLGALGIVRWIGRFVEREGIERTLELSNALVDALAKCGDVDGARKVFEGMTERNVVSWTAVIDGLAAHGRGREAIEVFESMRRAGGVVPDDVVFIGVLSACSHAGLVDVGCRYFDSMMDEYRIVPKIEHYGCMIDLFGRAGLVDRALGFAESMPMRPNSVILRTLLAACRTHGRHEDGTCIARRLIEAEPTQGSNYVLSSNIYAASRQWEKKTEMRTTMSKQGIWKIPGCSMLEVGCEVYEFVSGDKSHPEYKEILEMVEEVGRELRKAGYAPTTSEVLLDIDEEDKEDAVHRHSEKLAIAFALLKTPPGTTIRIVKNLRVCLDCHSATKFISKVYGREIVVRDRSRFHRFKDGECSCKDFW